MKCSNCGTEMKTGYSLKANTYGSIRVERVVIKDRMPKVQVCPQCGKLEMFVDLATMQ